MLWIQHSRWCRCSAGSKKRIRAESECACQEETNEVWNLALSFNCPVISKDGLRSMARQGRTEGNWRPGTCRDWHGVLCHGQNGKHWGGWNEIWLWTGTTGSATALHPWNQCPLSLSWQTVKKTLKSHCNGHCRGSRLHLLAAPQHTQFSHPVIDKNILPASSLKAFLFRSSPQMSGICAWHRADAFHAEQHSLGLQWKTRREKR